MTTLWFFLLCQFSAIACALVSGVFLAFSDFIMRSLNRTTAPATGIETMQVINREVFRWVFMFLLLGMSALSPFLIGYAYLHMVGSASVLIMTGGALYLVGVFAVSLVFNVPMNSRLDTMDYAGAEAAAYWANTYMPRWTFWNHVRTISSAGSAILYLLACVSLAQGSLAQGTMVPG